MSAQRRYNPLAGEWVLVSPHRADRPWLGAKEAPAPPEAQEYDPQCYLCPGNARASGEINPQYEATFVFPNDFPAVTPERGDGTGEGLLRSAGVRGEARVICFSPRHDASLGSLPQAAVRGVVDLWAAQVEEVGARYPWVQLFENRGAAMGASNPHPHGQLWATDYVPTLPARETACQVEHYAARGRQLLGEVLEAELADGERLVAANEHWALLVPFWATWPFEMLLLPRRGVGRLPELSGPERDALAALLRDGLRRYDALFGTPFPYSMGWHGAPTDGLEHPEWTLHAHFFPPLLRSAAVRKFMVGFELLAEPQRDVTPEAAAARLREL